MAPGMAPPPTTVSVLPADAAGSEVCHDGWILLLRGSARSLTNGLASAQASPQASQESARRAQMKSRRRLGVGLLCTMGLMVLCAGIAIAATKITCHGGPCDGTNGDDLIQGSAKRDTIRAKGGTDGVYAFKGSDFVFGGRGSDSPGSSPNGHNPAYHLEGGPGRDV